MCLVCIINLLISSIIMKKIISLMVLCTIVLCSCSANERVVKSRTQKYYDKVVQQKQFAIVNNQIIIFENANN
jgi:archaellum component FlaF (FlaF/FlaG flagellin family)